MSQKQINSKKKEKSKRKRITSYADIHHKIDKNNNKTDFTILLNNIKDKDLTSYGNSIHTLLYHAATKPNIKALIYLIKECKNRFSNDKISAVLNKGTKTKKEIDITPLTKTLLTLRKNQLEERLKHRHIALLFIGNGTDENCESVMEPHKDERKSADDYQIVKPIEVAFSLYDPELFLAILFRNIDKIMNINMDINGNPLIDIQYKIYKLWFNEYNKSKLNVIKLHGNDCSVDIFAEALRYLYMLKSKHCIKRKKSKCSMESIIDKYMIKYYKMINNSVITQLEAIKMYYHTPKTVENWTLGIHLKYDSYLKYHPCFDKKTYHKQRKGLTRFICVLPKIYNLKQLYIKWTQKKIEGDDKNCFELLRSLYIQCTKYGTITDMKLNGFNISSKSMDWLSDSIVQWHINWKNSLFGLITMGYLRNNPYIFPIDIVYTIYKYCFDKKRQEVLYTQCKTTTFKQLKILSLTKVGLNNECINKLCIAMKTSRVLRVNKLILNNNIFNIIGLSTICRFIEETDCIYLKHLEIKNCYRLDFKQSHYPLQIFLLVMSCIKQYNLVLFDEKRNDIINEQQKCEENYNAICQCIFRRYQKYFIHQHYISHHLFPIKSKKKLKRKKQTKRPASARAASTKTFFGSNVSTLPTFTSKSFFGAPSPALNVELPAVGNKRRISVPSLNQSTTKVANGNKFKINQCNKYVSSSEMNRDLFDMLSITPKKHIWEEVTNDIVTKCTKMRVLTENEKNVYFEKKKVNGMICYRFPVIKSSNKLSTKLYFEKPPTDKKSKKCKLGNHSHDLEKTRETNDFVKYDAKHKYLYIQIESIQHMLIEFDRIKAFDIQYLYIKLCSKQNCSLRLFDEINIDCMLCVKNANEIIFTQHCKITTIQMWLNNNKIIRIQPNCNINTVTSWYYQVNKILNKGILKHIAHCFVENPYPDSPSIFRNKNEIITYGYFYCNLDKFDNINGQITTNVIHHVKCNQYNCFECKENDDNNGKTNVFGIAYYQIGKRCNINDEISGNVLLFDCKDEFILEGKLNAQKQCFIHCNNKIKFEGNCNITFCRSNTQLTQDIFQQNHSKIFGYNYDTFVQLASNRATPLLWIKSTSFITNGAIIHDDNDKVESNPLLKCILTFDIEKKCEINNLNLSSNNKVYLLNTQNITINSSTFNTNTFYVNTIDDIECKTNETLNCIKNNKIKNIQIDSSTINSNQLYLLNAENIKINSTTFNVNEFYLNSMKCIQSKPHINLSQIQSIQIERSTVNTKELYINNVDLIICNDQTNINCLDILRVTNTNQFKTINNCGIYVKLDINNTNNNEPYYECVFDVAGLVSIEGILKGHDIKINANECNINGSIESNKFLLMVNESMTFVTNYQESVVINDLFCIKLQGTDVLLNDKALLIQAPNDICISTLHINNKKSLLSIKQSELISKGQLEVFKINNVQIESSVMNTNQILIHDIDVVECKNSGNIICCDKFEMKTVNQYNIMSNSTLSMRGNVDVSNNNFNECTMQIQNLFLENGATIDCSFQLFDVKCDNEIKLNGNLSIDNQYCKFKLQAIKSLLIGETCQFQSKSVYENNVLNAEDEKSIPNNADTVAEFLMQKNLDDDLNDTCCIFLSSDIKIEINGHITGNRSLCIVNCNQEINVSETSKLDLYCLILNSKKQIDFNGTFDCKHGELGIRSTKLLNLHNKSNICSWLALFYTETMHINGILQSDTIHLNSISCNIQPKSCIIAKSLLSKITETFVCSAAITVHESVIIECNGECRLENVHFVANVPEEKDNFTRNVDVNSGLKDKIKFIIRAASLSINDCNIIDKKGCNVTFEIREKLNVSKSKLISKSELNIFNAKSVTINSSTIETNTLLLKDIHCIQINKDTNVTSFNKVNVENVNDFKMNENSKLCIEYSADCENLIQKCIIETNNLFYMDSESNFYCKFKHFNIKSNDKIQIFGKIWLNESCKFKMHSNNQLLIASSGEIISQLNYVKKDKTKFLQKKTVNKQDLLDHVNNNLRNEYYLHLYCNNITNIYGKVIGKKSLVIIDANKEINIFDNGRVNGGETYIRCMNNISFSGTIDNDCGDCFIVANAILHLKKNGRISLLFLLFYGGHIIDECWSKTAANMSLDDVDNKLSNINDTINNFDKYKADKLSKFSKKIKFENAKKMFKFYEDEVNATINITGLKDANKIGKFLKKMNRLLFMILEQQEHLILLDVKLSKFIQLIDREFNYKLSMETYFDDKNLSKFVSILKDANFDELNKLKCKDEDEFENTILSLLNSIEMNLIEERQLRKICLKPELWQTYQSEKEKIIMKSVSEICPMLSLFFKHLNNAMQQTQTKALDSLKQIRSMKSLAIQTINATNCTAKAGLNIINDMFKQNTNDKYKFELAICGFLRINLHNYDLNNNSFTTLNKIIFEYYYSCTYTNDGILKLQALSFMKGIEECCSKFVEGQQQMTEGILLGKSILQLKPKKFEQNNKKPKIIQNGKEKDSISKPMLPIKKKSAKANITQESKNVKQQDNNFKKKIMQQIQNKENKENEENICQKLLRSWRLIKYYGEMQEKGWKDPSGWCKLTDDYLKYHLNFKKGHIARFKRKFNKWFKRFSLSTENKTGIHLSKALLTKWRLIQYFDAISKKGWEEPNDWILLTDNDLKNDLKFKNGHIARFKRFHKKWYDKQQDKSKAKLSSINCTSVSVVTNTKPLQTNNKIQIINKQKLDIDSVDAEQLWNVVENGIGQILAGDLNVLAISIEYFGFFGRFEASFEKFAQQENILKRGISRFTNWISKSETKTNNNQQSALECLTKDIAEFSNIKNQFSITITELNKFATGCMENVVRIMPNAETFQIAQIHCEKYKHIFIKKKQEYDNKVLELNDEYDTLFKQKLKLSAQKSTLQFEMEQRN